MYIESHWLTSIVLILVCVHVYLCILSLSLRVALSSSHFLLCECCMHRFSIIFTSSIRGVRRRPYTVFSHFLGTPGNPSHMDLFGVAFHPRSHSLFWIMPIFFFVLHICTLDSASRDVSIFNVSTACSGPGG